MSTDGVDSAGDGGQSGGNDNDGPSISEEARDSLDGGSNDSDRNTDGPGADAHGGDAVSDADDDDDDAEHGYDEVGVDVSANDSHEPTPAERAASQERMQAEAEAAKQAYEAQQAEVAADQSYAEALDQEVAAQNAAAIAADRIEAHTTSKNQRRGGPPVETVHTDRIAADIVHMAQTDPVGAQAVYEAAQRQLGEEAGAMQASLETELARDQLASDALLGDADYGAPDPAEVAREAERLVEAHTHIGGTRAQTTRTSFDINSMSYEIEQMALENPSMAAAVRAELARELTPAQASDMNRMIAGDATWEENLAIGFENPVDGLLGIGKGMVNGVSDLAEIAAKGAVYADALGDTVTAGVAGFVGLDGVAAAYDGMADLKYDAAAAIDVPEFELTNRAQQGGAVMGTIIDIGLAGKGLITGAAKLAARNVDEVAEAIAPHIDDAFGAGARTTGRSFDADQVQVAGNGALLNDAGEIVRNETFTRTFRDNTATFRTDADGRVVEVQSELKSIYADVPRTAEEVAAQQAAAARGLPTDHGGHIVPHRAMPGQGGVNMFPQNGVPIDELKNFNGSAYKTLENEIADWVEAGAEVKYSVRLDDFDAKGRPGRVGVEYEVFNSQLERIYKNADRFKNDAGQTFERVSAADIRELMGMDN